jgi:hypothetical protein
VARFLHVANGTSVTSTLDVERVPGLRSIWADPLHEGPVPAGLSDRELLDVRTNYLAGPAGVYAAAGGDDPTVDQANDMREWRAVMERREYEELVLWFEHDLFDQLNLIQLLAWIRGHLPADTSVSLICIGSFPGRPTFKGLGELSSDDLTSLLNTRAPVTDVQYALAQRAWEAFRHPSPTRLDALRHEHTSALPYLSDAITRFLQEYPWTRDGLSRTERRLLQLASEGSTDLWALFRPMGDDDRFYTITDLSLLNTAGTLSETVPALLTLDRSSERPLESVVNVTDLGRSVLEGQLDRVATCGIDRWLGGVHLNGRGEVWRWDDAEQRIVAP